MKKFVLFIVSCFISSFLFAQLSKAPAYPLITHDPYFSIWSFSDTLNASTTKYWTGSNQSLIGLIKADDKTYRFLGKEEQAFFTIVPTGEENAYTCRYTETDPGEGWLNEKFDDSKWKTGTAPFGNAKGESKTMWTTESIWVRREFDLKDVNFNKLFLKLRHDDDVEIYINGEKVYSCKDCWLGKYVNYPIDDVVKSKLKKRKNVMAMHCINPRGGAWLDAGIVKPVVTKSNNIIAAVQKSVEMTATQTIYQYSCGAIDLQLTFTSPLLMSDLSLLSKPVSYVSFKVKSNGGTPHNVQLEFSVSTDLAVNSGYEEVTAKQYKTSDLSILKAGTVAQPILKKNGDDLRIDWGYLYVAVPATGDEQQNITL